MSKKQKKTAPKRGSKKPARRTTAGAGKASACKALKKAMTAMKKALGSAARDPESTAGQVAMHMSAIEDIFALCELAMTEP